MLPMTLTERLGNARVEPLIDRISPQQPLAAATAPPDLRGYVELALQSGFPEAALTLSPPVRRRWLESYVDQLLSRDVQLVDAGRDPARLRRYFEAYALNSAG